jgi:seryl-tRNA synthetase
MIDLKALRDDPARFRKGASDKNYDPALIDQLLEADAALRAAMTRQQELTGEKNRLGKEIGRLVVQMKRASEVERPSMEEQIAPLRRRAGEIAPEAGEFVERVRALEAARNALWLRVPQPADPDVPVGAGADDNVELRAWNPAGYDVRRSFAANRGFEPKSHIELMQRHGMIDVERGVRMAGSRSYVLTGDGMRLSQAILRYAFDCMTQDYGFTPMSVPVLVRDEVMVGTGFFPDGREQAYAIGNPVGEHAGFSLTGTGEVGLMGLHMDEILPAEWNKIRRRSLRAAGPRAAGGRRLRSGPSPP